MGFKASPGQIPSATQARNAADDHRNKSHSKHKDDVLRECIARIKDAADSGALSVYLIVEHYRQSAGAVEDAVAALKSAGYLVQEDHSSLTISW